MSRLVEKPTRAVPEILSPKAGVAYYGEAVTVKDAYAEDFIMPSSVMDWEVM